jgi:hypothetical protein
MTIFTRQGPIAREHKLNPQRKPTPAQRRRLDRATAAIQGIGDYVDFDDRPLLPFTAAAPLRTQLPLLGDGLDAAKSGGPQYVALREGWSVQCFAHPWADDDAEWLSRLVRGERRANLSRFDQRIVHVDCSGQTAINSAIVPFACFPLSPRICAELICDLTRYRSSLAAEVFEDALRSRGFAITTDVGALSGHDPLGAYGVAQVGRAILTLHTGLFARMAVELADPDRYAAALREVATFQLKIEHVSVSLSNERAVWR